MIKSTKTLVLKNLLFSLLFLTLCFFYNYLDNVNAPANGVHAWRQSDGLSIAQKYYENSNSLFEPQMHNLLNGKGKAAGEFPIMYYAVGKLYHIFGNHIWVYRGLWWLISFLGYFFLFKFCSNFLKNDVWGGLISLFTFTSPVLIFYGFSFISDPIALSLIFISWFTLYEFYRSRGKKWLWISFILICLAALLKITALLSILALIAALCVNQLFKKSRFKISNSIILILLVAIILGGLTIFSWYYHASSYNEAHFTNYFYLTFAPIWELSNQEINRLNGYITAWSADYFYKLGWHILLAFSFLTILPIFNSSFKRFYYLVYIFCLLGSASFIMLFYSQFAVHDYYAVNLLFMIPITVLFFLKKYHFLLQIRYINLGFQILFSVLLVASIIHASKKSTNRFKDKSGWVNTDLYELRGKLEEFGISKNDLMVVPHDPSPNITLQAINMDGFTKLNGIDHEVELNKRIKDGVKWMLISDKSFYNDPIVLKYKNNLVVDFKGIRIYDLTK